MRRCLMVVAWLGMAGALAAQERPAREALVNQVVERFMENYRVQAGLTPEQNTRFRAVALRSFQLRREAERSERDIWLQLEREMRPGVAADADNVGELVDSLVASRVATVQRLQADMREYSTFLSPIQRAQLALMIERFQRNIDEVVRRRAGRLQGADR